jgi:hypothetical protein
LARASRRWVGFRVDGDTLMKQPGCNRRMESRTLLILPVSIAIGFSKHLAIIRDVSPTGMFLYSDFQPPLGAEIELKVTAPAPSYPHQLTYRATVVRLTRGVAGAAVGIGLSMTGTRPGTALQSLAAALELREAGMIKSSRLLH